jgi:hypothetical protein
MWYNSEIDLYISFTNLLCEEIGTVMQETYIHNDWSSEKVKVKMGIESIDVVKSYKPHSQDMKVAITVHDRCGRPVHKGRVEIALVTPTGSKYTLSRMTDNEGVALFELDRIDEGRWEVVVFDINHPQYTLDHRLSQQRWYVTDI